MKRVRMVAVGFVATLGLAAGIAVVGFKGRLLPVGRDLYVHRRNLQVQLQREHRDRPLVVWMGDSTIAGHRRPSYPQLIEQRLAGPERLESRVIAITGLDSYHHYFLMGPALALDPKVIFLAAHLRMFGERQWASTDSWRTFNDLASMLPAGELPRAVRLPLEGRGLTIPKLLLARALPQPRIEHALYFVEGLRTVFQGWALGVPPPKPLAGIPQSGSGAGILESYDVAISRELPAVRMLSAALAMARRAHVPIVVLGVPIPYEMLAETDHYDPVIYAQRFAVLRGVVEEQGGTFLDLHEALAREEFADTGGHYRDAGAVADHPLLYPASPPESSSYPACGTHAREVDSTNTVVASPPKQRGPGCATSPGRARRASVSMTCTGARPLQAIGPRESGQVDWRPDEAVGQLIEEPASEIDGSPQDVARSCPIALRPVGLTTTLAAHPRERNECRVQRRVGRHRAGTLCGIWHRRPLSP